MLMDKETARVVAEHLRLVYKELRWAANHIAALHDIMRPEEEPSIEDPNQLKLFEDECTGI
jgi:hypothetical protein